MILDNTALSSTVVMAGTLIPAADCAAAEGLYPGILCNATLGLARKNRDIEFTIRLAINAISCAQSIALFIILLGQRQRAGIGRTAVYRGAALKGTGRCIIDLGQEGDRRRRQPGQFGFFPGGQL